MDRIGVLRIQWRHHHSETSKENLEETTQVSWNILSGLSLLENSHHAVQSPWLRALGQHPLLHSQTTANINCHLSDPFGLLPVEAFRCNCIHSPTSPTSSAYHCRRDPEKKLSSLAFPTPWPTKPWANWDSTFKPPAVEVDFTWLYVRREKLLQNNILS